MKYNTFRLKEKKNPAGFKFKQWYFVEKFPNIKQQEGLKPPKTKSTSFLRNSLLVKSLTAYLNQFKNKLPLS